MGYSFFAYLDATVGISVYETIFSKRTGHHGDCPAPRQVAYLTISREADDADSALPEGDENRFAGWGH
jgi:hypothetical protein